MDGITTFSHKPLKAASYAGMIMSGAGFLYMFIVLYMKLFTNSTITGTIISDCDTAVIQRNRSINARNDRRIYRKDL